MKCLSWYYNNMSQYLALTIITSHQDFWNRAQRLLFFGYNTDIENSRENEDETGGGRGT